jgi:undecaprenyl-diphosphatase
MKQYGSFTSEQLKLLTVGNIVAFFVALLAIKFFITMLKKHGFRIWGIYRVIVGIALLIMLYTGYLHS